MLIVFAVAIVLFLVLGKYFNLVPTFLLKIVLIMSVIALACFLMGLLGVPYVSDAATFLTTGIGVVTIIYFAGYLILMILGMK